MNIKRSGVANKARPVIRAMARAILGKLPRHASRLSGPLAREGGACVRDVKLRPWASPRDGNIWRWNAEARAMFRDIYLRGPEGLPQPLAQKFSEEWASYCGCKYGLMLMHGTDALRIGIASVLDHDGLDYGGEIIVPNFSFVASATAPLDRRFGLVFVDVDPDTLLIDPRSVESAVIPGKTRAILPVHLFGQPADMASLRVIADKYNLKIIEDAAQAHGAIWGGSSVGSWGNAGAFSFQSSKNLACGEGGALVTNDESIFDRAHAMHNAGRPRGPDSRWQHVTLGWNCRPTEYQAALLIHRLKSFKQNQAVRAQNFDRLRKLMDRVEALKPLSVHSNVTAHGMYMFAMRYHADKCGGLEIDEFLRYVRAEGAPIHRAFDKTMANQPVIQSLISKHPEYFRCLPTPEADQATKNTVYIPQEVFLGTFDDMEDIVFAINKVEKHFSTRIDK